MCNNYMSVYEELIWPIPKFIYNTFKLQTRGYCAWRWEKSKGLWGGGACES
jgi:hypothetical protein